ncbi:MAG: hypothetical protein DMF05_11020 [Verrucomicrobia bacterium]|nr:MAG: hypothetical protein DMF05_11020 [Verrucomicrobiota bacterium]
MVLDADRKHRFVDVPHRDCPPTAARNLALFECALQKLMRRLQPLPNVFLPLYNNSLTGVRFECSRLRTMLAANAHDNPDKFNERT